MFVLAASAAISEAGSALQGEISRVARIRGVVGARMRIIVDVMKVFLRQVRVDLCSGQIGVSQHFLDRAQIGPSRQEMSGKGMAQSVSRHSVIQPGAVRPSLNNIVKPHTRKFLSP